jgi:hypothetical protein
VAQRNDRPAARRTEFGLQVRLPQGFFSITYGTPNPVGTPV